jgi:hypothetical protein
MSAMGPDYDAPRPLSNGEIAEEPLATIGLDSPAAVPDLDDDEPESFDLPDAELSGGELTVRVIPLRRDEFTCSRCFLVHHVTQLVRDSDGETICAECA